MIVYDKLWDALRNKNLSQNKLHEIYGISRSQINRLRHNLPVTTTTLDMLCKILECNDVSDIATYIPDHDTLPQK